MVCLWGVPNSSVQGNGGHPITLHRANTARRTFGWLLSTIYPSYVNTIAEESSRKAEDNLAGLVSISHLLVTNGNWDSWLKSLGISSGKAIAWTWLC